MIVRILFSNPTEWYKEIGSKLIRLIDESPASHCAIELESIAGSKVYEAVYPRSRKLKFNDWYNHNKIIMSFEFSIPESKHCKVYEWLEKTKNKKYPISQLFLIFKDKIKNKDYQNINGHEYLICSELVALFMINFLDAKFNECSDTIGVSDVLTECLKLELRRNY